MGGNALNKRLAALFSALLPLTAIGAEWQTDYGKALQLAKKRDVPVFVYFSDAEPGAAFDNLATLTEKFVLVKAVKNTAEGDKLFKIFEMPGNNGCSVVERTQEWQYSRYERKLSESELETVLKVSQGASGEPSQEVLQAVAHQEVQQPQPQIVTPQSSNWGSSYYYNYCPSCRRR